MLYKAGQNLSLCMKSFGVTIQTNAAELPGREILFIILLLLLMFSEITDIILYKVVLSL